MWQYEKKFSDGIFEFNLPLSGESGRYTVTVNSNVFDNALTTEFDYYSFEDIENIFKAMSKCDNSILKCIDNMVKALDTMLIDEKITVI